MTRWIVDGMNVVGSRPGGWWRDRRGAMGTLVTRLRRYAEATGDEMTVVFDGSPFDIPERDRRPVEVVFAPSGSRDAADDEIARLVSSDPAPDALIVVTSDRALAARAAESGARTLGAGAFLARLDEVAA